MSGIIQNRACPPEVSPLVGREAHSNSISQKVGDLSGLAIGRLDLKDIVEFLDRYYQRSYYRQRDSLEQGTKMCTSLWGIPNEEASGDGRRESCLELRTLEELVKSI